MTQTQKQTLKSIIQNEILQLTADIEVIQNQLKPIKKDCSLDSIDHKILKQVDISLYSSTRFTPCLPLF